MSLREKFKAEYEAIKQELELATLEFKSMFGIAQKFNDYKLGDGTIVKTDIDLAIGAKIDVVDTDGTMAPLMDGEYEIMVDEKPVKITVAAGYVTEMESPEVEETEQPEGEVASGEEEKKDEPMADEMPVEEMPAPDHASEMEVLKTEIENLKAVIAEIVAKMEGSMTNQEETSKSLRNLTISFEKILNQQQSQFALIEKIGSEPSVEPIAKRKEFVNAEDVKANFRKQFGL
jgi:hypothetical protein